MVTEIAEIVVRPGQEAEFERVMRDTVDLLPGGEGCGGVRLGDGTSEQGAESPGRGRDH